MTFDKKRYKLFGIVTNRDWEGSEVVDWLHKRCGKCEEAHSVMKEDLAGGKLPSRDFGENAAWWAIMVLAFNLNVGDEASGPSKIVGYQKNEGAEVLLINLPGRILEHARELAVRLARDIRLWRRSLLHGSGSWSLDMQQGEPRLIREPRVTVSKECSGEHYPKLPPRRALRHAWMTKPT